MTIFYSMSVILIISSFFCQIPATEKSWLVYVLFLLSWFFTESWWSLCGNEEDYPGRKENRRGSLFATGCRNALQAYTDCFWEVFNCRWSYYYMVSRRFANRQSWLSILMRPFLNHGFNTFSNLSQGTDKNAGLRQKYKLSVLFLRNAIMLSFRCETFRYSSRQILQYSLIRQEGNLSWGRHASKRSCQE